LLLAQALLLMVEFSPSSLGLGELNIISKNVQVIFQALLASAVVTFGFFFPTIVPMSLNNPLLTARKAPADSTTGYMTQIHILTHTHMNETTI
jgi:hypothetical protein